MWRHLSHNMGAVGFWLQYVCFKADTSQYPGRLKATAWHLATNSAARVVGFRCAVRGNGACQQRLE